MKRILCLLLTLSMLFVLAAGCASNTGDAQASPTPTDAAAAEDSAPAESAALSEDAAPSEDAVTVAPEIDLPLTTEPVTFTLFTGMMPPSMTYIDTMEECLVFQTLEERTGVHLSIETVHPSAQTEKFNLMVASGEYADLLNDVGSQYAGGISKALNDEVIIDLTDLVKNNAPNYWNIITADESVYRDTTLDDGSVAQFYNVFPNEQASWMGPMIRQDWLDALGLESPTTYDEYHDVLAAFKEKYNAGLWIPATGVTGNEWLTSGFGIAAYFSSRGTTIPYYVEDGTVKCGWVEEGMREYLTMMNSWYQEGLIYSDYISGDGANFNCSQDAQQLILDGTVGMWFAETDDMKYYPDLIAEEGADVRALAYPTVNEGDTLHVGYYNAKLNAAAYAISTNCEDPELATRWMNYWYSDEGNLLCNWGLEGQTFEYVDGKPQFTDLIVNNEEGMPFNVALFVYTRDSGPFVLDRSRTTYTYNDAQAEAEGIWTANYDCANTMPTSIALNQDESEEFAQYAGDICTYASEMINQYIMGTKDLSNFDSDVAQLKSLGIENCTALYQAAYDRYMEKKLP